MREIKREIKLNGITDYNGKIQVSFNSNNNLVFRIFNTVEEDTILIFDEYETKTIVNLVKQINQSKNSLDTSSDLPF